MCTQWSSLFVQSFLPPWHEGRQQQQHIEKQSITNTKRSARSFSTSCPCFSSRLPPPPPPTPPPLERWWGQTHILHFVLFDCGFFLGSGRGGGGGGREMRTAGVRACVRALSPSR